MKKFTTTTAVLLLSILITQAQAQDFVFRVLANKGDSQLKVHGEEDGWRPIKTGEKLRTGDEIKVVEGTYLGLVHHTGKTLEVKQAGQYSTKELADRMKQQKNGVLGKYADFLMSKVSEEDEDVVKDYRKYQNATGAVKRALSTATALKVLMPHTSKVVGPEITIRWIEADMPQPPTYLVTLKNQFSQTIKTIKTQKPFITLDLADSVCNGEKLLIFDVRVAGKKRYRSEEYGIKKMKVEKSHKIKKEVAVLTSENTGESAMAYLLKATYFEEKDLPLDAITAYEKAITLEPEVAEFKVLYSKFIAAQKF